MYTICKTKWISNCQKSIILTVSIKNSYCVGHRVINTQSFDSLCLDYFQLYFLLKIRKDFSCTLYLIYLIILFIDKSTKFVGWKRYQRKTKRIINCLLTKNMQTKFNKNGGKDPHNKDPNCIPKLEFNKFLGLLLKSESRFR